MIVVATADFELYHDLLAELRARDVEFTSVQPGDPLPERTTVLLTGEGDDVDEFDADALDADVETVRAAAGEARAAVEEAVTVLRGDAGRTVVGIDPGPNPGIAVLSGGLVVAAFRVPVADAADVVLDELEDAPDPVVRVGDGARRHGTRIVEDLATAGVTVELVDETGTTPHLGTGVRGLDDVLAAVNVARIEGDVVESRSFEPTAGELQDIKTQSRKRSGENRAITEELARRVARGQLTLDEAIEEHREE